MSTKLGPRLSEAAEEVVVAAVATVEIAVAVAAVVAGVATVTNEFSPGKFEETAPSRFRRRSWFATTLQSQPLPLLGYVLANACGPSVRFNRSGIDALSLAHVDCRYPCAP